MATKVAGKQSIYDDRVEISTAARNGDVERVLAILERTGMDVNFHPPFLPNSRVVQSHPPLFAACQEGQLEVVKALLKLEGIKVNCVFGDLTPLSDAAKGGYVEIMRLLIDHGARLDNLTPSSFNPLMIAVHNGHCEATALLLGKGADPNYQDHNTSSSPLTTAAKKGYSNLVKLLLDNGANIEPKRPNISPSALVLACSGGHTECARLLIERGANLNAKSYKGTPLTSAVYNHHTECAELLLEKGADVNQPKDISKDETPLMIASERGHTDLVQLLLKYGANVAAKEKHSRLTALYKACEMNHLEVAKVLIANGADFNQIPNKALEILLEVIGRKHSDLACLLIQNGARIDTSNSSRETPLTCAVQSKEMKVIEVLVEFGAPIDPEAISRAIRTRNSSITSFLLQKADRDTVHEMNDDLVQAAVDGDHNFAEMLLPHVRDINVQLKSGNTALMEAAKGGYVEIMRLLIDRGAHLNDSVILMSAVRNGHYEATEFLLKKGANPNDYISSSLPLVTAAEKGYSKLVKLLLDYGAKIDAPPGHHGRISPPALIRACSGGHTECARLLIEYGANLTADFYRMAGIDTTPLISAVANHQTECAELLLEKGANVDEPSAEPTMDKTPLMIASENGHVDLVQLLLKYGANMAAEAKNHGGLTALYKACENNRLEVAKVLIENGADFNQIPDMALEVLLEVIGRKHSDLACLLIQNGAKINASNSSGETPLTCTVQSEEMKVIEVLVECGAPIVPEAISRAIRTRNSSITSFLLEKADRDTVHEMNDDLVQAAVDGDHNFAEAILPRVRDINVQLKSGNTALMEATKLGKEEHVKLLLDHGAQVNVQDMNGYTALMMASQGGHTKCVEHLLTQKDIDVNLQNSKECTALMLASENGHTNVVELLLVNNASLEIVTTRGCSALFYGVKSNSPAVVKVLLVRGADVGQKTLDDKNIIQYAYECHNQPDRQVIEMLKEALSLEQVTPTLAEAFKLLLPIASAWRNIGVLLGIPFGVLMTIEADSAKVEQCLLEMLTKWLSHVHPRPTWSSLAEAVKLFDPSIAKEIREKYCSNEVSPTSETHQPDEDQDTDSEEDFEATDNEAHFLAALEKVLREKYVIEHTVVHGSFVSIGRSGASSLMSRLAGEMPSPYSSSTGVAERVVQVEVTRSSSYSAMWKKILYNDEAIKVVKVASHVSHSHPPTPTDKSHPLPVTPTTVSIGEDPVGSTLTAPVLDTPSTSASLQTPKATPSGYVPPKKVFMTALQEAQGRHLHQHFENSWTLYLTDTGSQVEFQEVLPLLVSGPSIFFITFDLKRDLNQRFIIEYHLPDGGRSTPYQSTLTGLEAILQTLASVASMGVFTYSGSQTRNSLLKPKVLIVGTHKDQLDPSTAESKIKEIDWYLQKVIKSTAHYNKDLVVFSSESQLIFTVNNFSEDDSDFEKIRSSVDRVVHHGEFKMSYPVHWLIFSFVLRQQTIKDRIISYEQCFAIAQDCGITTREELNHALWFLHTKTGQVRHFPTPGLDDIVIRDPQVLFDHVTHLIVKAFTFENFGKRTTDEFKCKGIFSFEDFMRISQFESLLTPDKFLCLLKLLRIVFPFQTEDGGLKYFIPSVLAHSNDSQSPTQQNSDTPPLLITFKCGYCPKGLTGALIVYLLTNKMKSNIRWELVTDRIFRDQVSFLVSPIDIITLKIHPMYLELVHLRDEKWKFADSETYPIQSVCSIVFQSVEKALRKVSSDMNLTSDAEHSFEFYCQDSDCVLDNGNHPARLERHETGSVGDVLICRSSGRRLMSSPPPGYSLWLKESDTESLSGKRDNVTKEAETNSPTLKQTVMITEHPQPQQNKFGEKVSFSVTANGIGEQLSYQWKKDDDDITFSTYPCCEGATTSVLSIACALPLYEGQYKCLVSNELSEVESQTARLQVLRISGPKLTVEELELISKMLIEEENAHGKLKHFNIDFRDQSLTFQEVCNVLGSLDIAEHVIGKLTSELDNLKHFQAYQLALQRGVNVSIRYFKLLFYGPPRVGKTSARRRLVGEILNLQSARSCNPETKEIEVSSSTGAAESSHVIVQLNEQKHETTTALLTSTTDESMPYNWTYIKNFNENDLNDELVLLYRFIHEATHEVTPTSSTESQPILGDSSHNELVSSSPSTIETKSDDRVTPALSVATQQISIAPVDGGSDAAYMYETIHSKPEPSWKETNKKVLEAFNNVLKSKHPNEYLNVFLKGTSLINMIDTGGQPAFLEMLPVLTVGPALYLVFLNLIQKLKDRYEVRYATTKEGETSLGTSSYTIQEIIFQILSSIVAFSRIEGNKRFPDSPQAVLLVGTHKDKLDSTATVVEKDKAVQRELNQVLQSTICSELLCRASDSDKSLVLAIDNETGDQEEVQAMRRRLEEIIKSKFEKYDIPATWLMFNLFLRKLALHDIQENSEGVSSVANVGVIPLEQCKDIAMELHVTDLEDALWFFHHVVGSLMYFPEVKELNDIVICDPQVVFDSVTTLIIQTFKSDDTASNRFKETGQFSFEDIEKAVRGTSGELLPPAKLICLLEYRNIIAPIEAPPHSKSSKWYFFPAVLECATNEQLQEFEQPMNPNDPPPLMIHFKFGFVPMGLFCAVIAKLVCQIHSHKLGWVLQCDADTNKPLYKNLLTFRTGDTYDITLISQPKRFEVHLTQPQTENAESSHDAKLEACKDVLLAICDTLDEVISQIKHLNLTTSTTKKPIYQLGFKCPQHLHSDSDDLLLNKATSDSSRSPKLLWYDFLSNHSCFQCLNSEKELSKNEVFNLNLNIKFFSTRQRQRQRQRQRWRQRWR